MKPKQIETDEMMEQKMDYLHQNPGKRGYVADSLNWRYSSARHYAGLPGLNNTSFVQQPIPPGVVSTRPDRDSLNPVMNGDY